MRIRPIGLTAELLSALISVGCSSAVGGGYHDVDSGGPPGGTGPGSSSGPGLSVGRDAGLGSGSGSHRSSGSGTRSDGGADAGSGSTSGLGDGGSGQCVIDSVVYPSGTANPNDSCQFCQPSVSTSAWDTQADGTACGTGGTVTAGMVCHGGQCVSGCEVGGTFSGPNALNPTNACQSCQPSSTTTAWTDLADGAICGNGQFCGGGQCGTECEIGSAAYASGAVNPSNPCESCQPGTSTSAWTSTDGVNAGCPTGEVCSGSPASCTSGCWIGGAFYSSGATASSGCQVCNPGASTTAWTNVVGAASCPSGQACSSGACASGCAIGGTFYDSGATSNDGCEVCTPSSSTTSWTDATGAASCTSGQVCNAGSCASGCSIGGIFYAPAATTNDGCEICTPGTSTTAWTNATTGTNCGNGEVCSGGTCGTQCDIGGTIYASGAANPSNVCQTCQPGTTTSAWTSADGVNTKCPSAEVCNGNPASCMSGCWISNGFVSPGTIANSGCGYSARPHRARRRGRR